MKMVQGQFKCGTKENVEKEVRQKRIYINERNGNACNCKGRNQKLLHTANESRKFLTKVNTIWKDIKHEVLPAENKEGKIASDKNEILSRWKAYFEESLGEEIPAIQNRSEDCRSKARTQSKREQLQSTMEEVDKAIKILSVDSNRTPRPDNIHGKLSRKGVK